jgi:hypothetical protein
LTEVDVTNYEGATWTTYLNQYTASSLLNINNVSGNNTFTFTESCSYNNDSITLNIPQTSPITTLVIPENITASFSNINNNGIIQINSSGDFKISGAVTNESGAVITNDGSITNNSGATITNESGGTITNNSSAKITNDGEITNNSGATITNTGIINNEGSINEYGPITGSGTITGNGSINIYLNSSYLSSFGSLSGNTFTLNSNFTLPLYYILNITEDYELIINDGIEITNNSTITINPSATITNNGVINNQGTIVEYGTITGSGTITGNGSINIYLNSSYLSSFVSHSDNTFTLNKNFTLPSYYILNITSSEILNIYSTITLTNNGVINNQGAIVEYGTITGSGTITGNGSINIYLNSSYLSSFGSLSGNTFTLTRNFTLPSSYILIIEGGWELYINSPTAGETLTFTNNGQISNSGAIYIGPFGNLNGSGTITGNPPIQT